MSAMLHLLLGLVLAPLLPGVVNRVKAFAAGRAGKPLFQLYYDLTKLARKGAVYSHTTTWVFRAGPTAGLAAMVTLLCLLPLAGGASLIAFQGDFLLASSLLGIARFASILAAMDTGSAFEGMGASREATFSALAEPAFLLALMPLGLAAGSFSLSAMLHARPDAAAGFARPAPLLLALAFFLLLLVENSRIPADDPTTHLELTMIHEALVLDHCGVDLACIEYAASLKLWFFASVIVSLLFPPLHDPLTFLPTALGGIFLVAAAIGVTESVMARLRLFRVPQMLSLAGALASLACLFCLR